MTKDGAVTNLDKPLRHDIRDHLNSIYMTAETIKTLSKDRDISDLANSQLRIIDKVNELLDLTRAITAPTSPLPPTPQDPINK